MRTLLTRFFSAVAAGLLAAACLPQLSLPAPLLIVAITVFALTLTESRAANALMAFGFGVGYFGLIAAWLRVIGNDAWIAAAVFCSLYWVVAAVLNRDRLGWQFASIFTAAELLRDAYPFGGLGWGQFALIAGDLPLAPLLFAMVGQTVVTWLMWWIGGAIAELLRDNQFRPVLNAALVTGAIAALGALTLPPVSAGTESIGLVQAGVDHTGIGTLGDPRSVAYRNIRTTTQAQAELRLADLVVWPENAVDVDPRTDALLNDDIKQVAYLLKRPLLVGAVLYRGDGRLDNASLIYRPGRAPNVLYTKQHLAPFGEYVPMRQWLEKYTSRFALVARDFAPGEHPAVLKVGNAEVGVLICFEVADSGLAWQSGKALNALLVQTNTATYTGTGESAQQLQYARLRAMELRVPVFLVATNGISAVINADGSIAESIGEGEVGTLTGSPAGSAHLTPAASLRTPAIVLIWLSAGWILTSSWRSRRKVEA